MNRRMALYVCALLCMLCACTGLAEDSYHVTEDSFLAGTITIDGTEIVLDAVFDDHTTEPLIYVKVKAADITQAMVEKAIRQHFTIGKQFTHGSTPKGCFAYWSLVNNYSPIYPEMMDYHEILPEVRDDHLRAEVARCRAFLDSLGIAAAEVPAYATYGEIHVYSLSPISPEEAQTRPNSPYAIKLLLTVEGVPMMPNTVGDRGSLDGVNMDYVMSDMPYAYFNFAGDGELLSVHLYAMTVAETQEVKGDVIPWQEALANWYRYFTAEDMFPDYFEGCEIRIKRLQVVWLANFHNVLRPGWYIEFCAYDPQTGEVAAWG